MLVTINRFLEQTTLVLGLSLLFPLIAMGASQPRIEKGTVVSSIKPIHSLVEAVLGEIGSSVLLIDGSTSMHNYQLKPSQQRALSAAKVVFFVDKNAETFLNKAFAANVSNGRLVALADDPALTLLKKRQGDDWQQHEHEEHIDNIGSKDQHEDHGRNIDFHIWLNPQNAVLMARKIEAVLKELFPHYASELSINTQTVIEELRAIDAHLERRMLPLIDQPFIVFHDAFGYFENRYSLKGVGSVLIDTGLSPSVSQIRAIRRTIESTSAVCVFSEPQFSEKIISVVTEGKNVKSARVDPLAAKIDAGRALYFQLMRDLAIGFEQCLGN